LSSQVKDRKAGVVDIDHYGKGQYNGEGTEFSEGKSKTCDRALSQHPCQEMEQPVDVKEK